MQRLSGTIQNGLKGNQDAEFKYNNEFHDSSMRDEQAEKNTTQQKMSRETKILQSIKSIQLSFPGEVKNWLSSKNNWKNNEISSNFDSIELSLKNYKKLIKSFEQNLNEIKSYQERRDFIRENLKDRQVKLIVLQKDLNKLRFHMEVLGRAIPKRFHNGIHSFRSQLRDFCKEESLYISRQLYLKENFGLKDVILAGLRHESDPTKLSPLSMGIGSEPYLPSNKHEEPKIKKAPEGIYDDRNALDGRGIMLAMRHLPEKFDPQHRGWRNGFNHRLQDLWANWKENAFETKSIHESVDEAGISTTGDGTGRIHYFTEIERCRYLANSRERDNKLVYQYRGKEIVVPDTDSLRDIQGEGYRQKHIFVMDLNGNLYIAQEGPYTVQQLNIRLQHPSFTGGDRIICGGELTIKDGKVTRITNESGHYVPGPFSVYRVIEELRVRGVLAEEAIVDVRAVSENDNRFVTQDGSDMSVDEFEKRVHGALEDIVKEDARLSPEKRWESTALAKRDLSEKPNPYSHKFVSEYCFVNINAYLAKRAKETKTGLNAVLGYSAKEYYERRNNWIGILTMMSNPCSKEDVIESITSSIAHFGKGKRHDYVDQLQILKNEIEEMDEEHFEQCLPQTKITNDLAMYKEQVAYTENVTSYFSRSIFSSAKKSFADISRAQSCLDEYRALRSKGNAQEFLTCDELHTQECKYVKKRW